jgi:NAD(P)-dependent dehydrogenase (short-subunit alcohol dehydrogenase family)
VSRVALIIGGASGIGLASAMALAERGLIIAVADLSHASASQAVDLLQGTGHRARAVDVSDEKSVGSLFDSIEDDLGPVAVLVICAGISGYIDGKRPSLRETSLDSWNEVFSVNAAGSFLSLREMFRRRALCPADNPRAILIGSMAAQDGGTNSPAAYVASKGAVHALVKAAVKEGISLGITVNCIAPGVVDTPMLRSVIPASRFDSAFMALPMGRVGLPRELATAVAFLASTEASFITGACLDVNGGARLS